MTATDTSAPQKSAPARLHYSATLMLFRDGPDGEPEVLLLERSGKSESFGGAFVFPGGKVDLHDAHGDFEALCAGLDDHRASAILGVPRHGLAYWMGAIRESFEEAGILLAYDRDGAIVRLHEPETKARFADYRAALNRGEITLLDICRREHLRLATDQLLYYSHWVTPVPMPRRFDTRFFVCRAPEHQESIIDNHEAVSQVWINPAEALRRAREDDFAIFFPTIKNLEGIARHRTTAELLIAVAAQTEFPRVLPLRVDTPSGKPGVLLPGDPGYVYHEPAETHY